MKQSQRCEHEYQVSAQQHQHFDSVEAPENIGRNAGRERGGHETVQHPDRRAVEEGSGVEREGNY